MNTNLTEILVIQDRSGSMDSVRAGTIEGFNKLVADQAAVGGEARITLVQFDHEYNTVFAGVNVKDNPFLNDKTYVPRGCTALYDAACRAIDELGKKLANTPEADRPGQVVVVIQTDGFENASQTFHLTDLQVRIKEQENVYNWKFMFFGAGIDAMATGALYGISPGLTAQYVGDLATTKGVYTVASNAITRGRSGMSMNYTKDEVASLNK